MLVVYTAIIGGFNDKLRPPPVERDPRKRPVKYVCFTDCIYRNDTDPPRASGSPRWEIRLPLWEHRDSPRRTARWHKVMAHEALYDYKPDYSLWLDGSHQLDADPWSLVDRYMQTNVALATFKHCQRDCVYEEAKACVALRKDDKEVIAAQMDRYAKEGVKPHAGLFETSVFMRRCWTEVERFNALWWAEISAGSLRDQLSVNYAARKTGLAYNHIEGTRYKSPHFTFYSHR